MPRWRKITAASVTCYDQLEGGETRMEIGNARSVPGTVAVSYTAGEGRSGVIGLH